MKTESTKINILSSQLLIFPCVSTDYMLVTHRDNRVIETHFQFRDWGSGLLEIFSMLLLKWCENCDLKSVVKTRVYSIHKKKNVFGIIFQITCFSVWKNIIVYLVCLCVCVCVFFFFFKDENHSIISYIYFFIWGEKR